MKINISFLRQLPIDNLSLINTFPLAIFLIGLADVFLFNFFLDLGKKLYNFYTGSSSETSCDKSHVEVSKNSSISVEESKQPLLHAGEVYCGREDIEIVMKSLGISCEHEESGKKHGSLNAIDLSNIFQEETPMFDELKEAFDVFDENRDGFIDAEDLQRVLNALGFNEGLELENCRKMIRVYDENNDDRIDFDEFLNMFGE